jgi:hypothetical protein
MDDIDDVVRAGADGRCQARELQEALLAAAARPVARVPVLESVPHLYRPFSLLEIHQQRLFHHYLHSSPMIPARLLRDIEERRRLFVEGCRAREAAFDANPPPLGADALAFTLALAASAGGPVPH